MPPLPAAIAPHAPTPLAFLNLGFAEMVVFGVIALLVFGDKLPEVMRNLGKGYVKFRRGLQDATRPVREEMARIEREANRPPPPPVRPTPAPDTTTFGPTQPPAGDFRVPYPTGLEDAPPPSPRAPLPPPSPEAPTPEASPPPAPARTSSNADDEPPPV